MEEHQKAEDKNSENRNVNENENGGSGSKPPMIRKEVMASEE